MTSSVIPHAARSLPASRTAAVRFGRAGALHDLVVTVAFATPWTATAMLALQRGIDIAFGFGGAPLPELGPVELMFVSMMGTAVTMWAIARIRYPIADLGGYRQYPEATAARVRFIGRAKALGFTLSEIEGFLEVSDRGAPPMIDDFVAHRLADLDRRVDDLLRVRAALVSLAEAPPLPGACPVIDALGASDQAAEELLG